MTTQASSARILWLASGTLLAVLLTICAGLSLAGNTVGSVTRNEHHVIPGTVSEVSIDANSGDVTLVPATGSQIVVDSHARGTFWLPKLKTEVHGGHLTLSGSCHHMAFGHCESTFTVRVPAGIPVSVSSGSGDVRAADLSGRLNIDAGSGDIALSGLGGGTTARVGSGDIDASRVGGPLVLQTGSGDIDAAELTSGAIDARAGSGDVFIDVAQVPKRVHAVSSSGDVVIAVPHNGEGYDAQVSTSSGHPELRVNRDSRGPGLVAITGSGDATIAYR